MGGEFNPDPGELRAALQLEHGSEPLRSYDEGDDRFAKRRYRNFTLYVVVPAIALVAVSCWVLGIQKQPAVKVAQAVPSVVPVVAGSSPFNTQNYPVSGGSQVVNQLPVPAVPMPPPAGVVTATPAIDGVRCFAVVDTGAFYGGVYVVRSGAMLIVQGFTRVNGGMIWSKRYGWYRVSDFRCAGDLAAVEVEFVDPGQLATLTAVARPSSTVRVVVPRATATITPTETPFVTPTYQPGVLLFGVDGCDVVWLVWGARMVFLSYGGQSYGVAGDAMGEPVRRDLCGYSGSVGLRVVLPNGQEVNRRLSVDLD